MIYSVNELRKETIALIKRIDAQIDEVDKQAKTLGIDASVMRDREGNWPIIPLLTAKAAAYNTLVLLQTSERSSARR